VEKRSADAARISGITSDPFPEVASANNSSDDDKFTSERDMPAEMDSLMTYLRTAGVVMTSTSDPPVANPDPTLAEDSDNKTETSVGVADADELTEAAALDMLIIRQLFQLLVDIDYSNRKLGENTIIIISSRNLL